MSYRMVLFLILLLPITVYGSCKFVLGKLVVSESGPELICVYDGEEVEEGDSFLTEDCHKCTCNSGTLECCGYGIEAGLIIAPPGCKVIAEGCEARFVSKEDETKDCVNEEEPEQPHPVNVYEQEEEEHQPVNVRKILQRIMGHKRRTFKPTF